jgi:5-methylcytosine-specific restriction enzyme A
MPDGRGRNPDWEWDEIVLACDLVMQNQWKQIDASDPRVAELSRLLQLMPLHPQEARQANFRNDSGVARKTADIATSHPDYQGRRTNGNALDRKVLDEFRARPDVMHALAESIRTSVTDDELPSFPSEVGYEGESEMEGRYLLRVHAYRERSPGLRRRKIESVRRRGEPLACAACGFDFERFYGDRGKGYIECHHVIPLHATGERKVSISDLALLCSNCHRMIHTKPPWPTPAELGEIIRRQGAVLFRTRFGLHWSRPGGFGFVGT